MTRNPEFEKSAIRNLQRYLRQLSYFDDDIPPLPESGSFDPHTRDALIAFQRINGLEPTGIADERTWNLLFDQYTQSVEERSEPKRMPIYPRLPEREVLTVGDVGFPVVAVQYMLDQLTVQFENLDGVPQNGIYDRKTAEAVSEFQRRHLLPITGEVDKKTWDTLVVSYDLVTKDYQR